MDGIIYFEEGKGYRFVPCVEAIKEEEASPVVVDDYKEEEVDPILLMCIET